MVKFNIKKYQKFRDEKKCFPCSTYFSTFSDELEEPSYIGVVLTAFPAL